MSPTETPDVRTKEKQGTACCSSEETNREAVTKATKYRQFAIRGDITVSEKVTFSEKEVEEENSCGVSKKNTVTV